MHMLILARTIRDLNFSKLMDVYIEGNMENADEFWAELSEGKYICALRLEPYCDGLLLEALETAPAYRRRGYAEKLILAAIAHFAGKKLYSHVSKRNVPSLCVHEKCGFRRILEYAVYIDGSVNQRSCTLCLDR